MRDERVHELLRRGRCEVARELDNKEVFDAELADERELVFPRSQEMWRILRAQYFHGMRIERDDDRRAIGGVGVTSRGGDDFLVSAVDTVKDAYGEENRAAQGTQLGNVAQRFHPFRKDE